MIKLIFNYIIKNPEVYAIMTYLLEGFSQNLLFRG